MGPVTWGSTQLPAGGDGAAWWEDNAQMQGGGGGDCAAGDSQASSPDLHMDIDLFTSAPAQPPPPAWSIFCAPTPCPPPSPQVPAGHGCAGPPVGAASKWHACMVIVLSCLHGCVAFTCAAFMHKLPENIGTRTLNPKPLTPCLAQVKHRGPCIRLSLPPPPCCMHPTGGHLAVPC